MGAGLGGLTAAGFLQRAGFTVKVYEQAPAFSRIGAGIILSANVCKVLRRLGLEEGLIAAGVKSQSYVSRAWDTGEVMAEFIFDAEHERLYGGPYVHIHRGDLHAVLERGVTPGTIAFDHQLVDLRENGGATRLVFANGATAEADVVIGADGIRSKVREILLGPEPPQFVGAVAYRAIFPAASAQRALHTGLHQMVGHRPPLPALLSHRAARRGLCHRRGARGELGARRYVDPGDPRAISGIVCRLSFRSAARAASGRYRDAVADVRSRA